MAAKFAVTIACVYVCVCVYVCPCVCLSLSLCMGESAVGLANGR
jgi:hypothetical protein